MDCNSYSYAPHMLDDYREPAPIVKTCIIDGTVFYFSAADYERMEKDRKLFHLRRNFDTALTYCTDWEFI